MRVLLNLASRPYSDLGPAVRRLRMALAVLALLCVGLGFGLRQLHRKAELARGRERVLDYEIARVNAERAGYQRMMAEPANAQLLAQSADLNQLFEVKAFSWTLAMEALETVLPAGVQVSSIEPLRDKNGQIELHLRVAGPRDRADELVQNLEHSRRFFRPRIVGENSEASTGTNQRLEPVSASNRFDFDLVTEYNPPTAEEARQARAEARAKAPPGNPASQKAKTPAPLGKPALPAASLARPAAVAQPSAAYSNRFASQQQPAAAAPAPAAQPTLPGARPSASPFARRSASPVNGPGASPITSAPTSAPTPPAAPPATEGGAK
jgi:type IV pilus assembly protein PilN